MYYIVAGEEICYAVRGPKEIADEVLNQEIYVRAFNYDDEEIWSDEALDLERERVFRDEYALTALDAEQDRRTIEDGNYRTAWYDDAASVIRDLSTSLEADEENNQNDYEETLWADAAERLSDRVKRMSADDPFLRKFESDATEFLRQHGFDISTHVGCIAALEWLEKARVEDAFWDEGRIDNASDWYIGETRLDAMIKIVRARLE